MRVLAAWFVLLAAVLTFNVLVDPFAIAHSGLLPPAIETDRTIKLDLIEHLKWNPRILILGSSRARQAEPAFLRRLTGLRGFNAAVTGGTAADAWVMTRAVADRFPHGKRSYIWFVDSGIATNGVNPQLEADPRARRYIRGDAHGFSLRDVGSYLGTQATSASWRVVRACGFNSCRRRLRYRADGSIAHASLRNLPEHARSLNRAVAKAVAAVKAHPPPKPNTNPARYAFFERALGFMNAHGSEPVIVLNPIHPRLLAALRQRGFPLRRAGLAYLQRLHERFRFVVVDCQDIRTWGGIASDFSNPTHVNQRNMRRMLGYVVAHADGALR